MENKNDNKVFLDVVTAGDCEKIRQWRNQIPETLRTPFKNTYEQQLDFYTNVLCNKSSPHKYWGIFINTEPSVKTSWQMNKLIGMGGITNIQWENGLGEISLILGAEFTGKGFGNQALKLLLDMGFNQLRLNNIFGECYKCNKNIGFWKKQIAKYNATAVILPARKYYNGEYYDSLYFNFNEIDFEIEDENGENNGKD
jgi:RimJ/RimL family protein N-acetyltransferase